MGEACASKIDSKVTNMKISRDGDIRDAYGLTDEAIGELIGKSRQAVNHGLKSSKYFKTHEWVLIVLHLRKKIGANLRILYDYLSSLKAGEHSYLHTITSQIGYGTKLDELSFNNLYILIADYRHFSQANPICNEKLISLVARENLEIKFFTSSEIELNRFKSKIAMHNELGATVTGASLPEADQYPYMICIDPFDETNSCFLTCISDTFQEIDSIRGESIFTHASRDIQNVSSEPLITARPIGAEVA